jgi:hypothetical protein
MYVCLAGEPPGALSVPNFQRSGRWDAQPAGGGTLGRFNPPEAGRWDTLAAGIRDAGTRTTAGGGQGCGTLGRSARRRRNRPTITLSVNVQMNAELGRSDAQPAKGGTLGRPA